MCSEWMLRANRSGTGTPCEIFGWHISAKPERRCASTPCCATFLSYKKWTGRQSPVHFFFFIQQFFLFFPVRPHRYMSSSIVGSSVKGLPKEMTVDIGKFIERGVKFLVTWRLFFLVLW